MIHRMEYKTPIHKKSIDMGNGCIAIAYTTWKTPI